ncbi:hypothetical protein ABBQ38_014781 [Trebouxia sp. C0009 RCD-2024]
MGLLDEVIVISDDDDDPSQPRRSKRLRTSKSPSKPGSVLDMTLDDTPSPAPANDEEDVDIMGSSSDDVDIIDLDHYQNAGPSTPARGKGKSVALSPQQQALQAAYAAIQTNVDKGDRAGRQNWLQGRLAELPCNLPEQLQALMLNGAGADGQDHGPVTRRAMLELLPSATVRMAERSVYEAASRAVLHQREPDGTRKAPTPTPPPEGGPSPPAGQPEVQVAADERRTVGGGRGRGGRGGRGGRRGRRAASTAPEDQGAATSPAAVLKGTSKGKRKADHMEGSSAQQAKHAQHVLKRKDRAKPPTCPMCHSDTILACDKLEGVSFAELKMIMGYRCLPPGRSHRACVDALTASCQGLTHICPLCHGSITTQGDALPPSQPPGSSADDNPSASSAGPNLLGEAEARWADATVQQCLDLCSNVDLVYKLLIQDIHPVLVAADPPSTSCQAAAGRGRGRGSGGGRGGGRTVGGLPVPKGVPWPEEWDEEDEQHFWNPFSAFSGSSAPSSSAGWAKGTGYGGSGSFYGMGGPQKDAAEEKCREAAALRQQVVDQHLQRGITNICNCLETAISGQANGGLVPDCPPVWATSVLFGGPFAAALRLLLQNDSVMELGSKGRIYGELLRLLDVLGSNIDLVPLLYEPAQFETKLTDAPGGSAPSGGPPQREAPSVLDALHSLNQQCHVFKKSAEQLASGSMEDIGALSLALQIIDASQELQETVAHLKKLMPKASDRHADQTQPAAHGVGSPGRPSSGTRASTEKKKGKGKQAAAAAAAQELDALQASYVEKLKPLSFREFDLLDTKARFHFRNQALASKSGGGEVMRKWLRRVSGEHASLSGSLPLAWTSSIFVAADPSRLDILRALIIGPADTPYANGCFVFDIFLPSNYPNVPPQVHFMTTGGGRVRFNPNLYECGKVCLSLLGTWSGPSWDPTASTLLQVLISIQSMILVDDPYFNEPGYETSRATAHGKAANDSYNKGQQLNTLSHAIWPALKQPDPCFAEIIKLHFQLKKGVVRQQLQDWLAIAGKQAPHQLKEITAAIRFELESL